MTVTSKEMKEIERKAAQSGLPYLQMMENAGRAAFETLLRRLPDIKSAAVFCGSGNNGGDGYVTARLLKQHGAEVLIIMAAGKPKTDDATTNLYLASMLDIPMVTSALMDERDAAFIRDADAVIDAVYGTGFHGELNMEAEICCGAMNMSQGLKLALDLPTGVECDSGRAAQGALRADLTVAFHAFKPCHELAREYCGELELADIGIK